jgi:hypothetical protein
MLFSFLIDKAAPEIKNQSPDLLFPGPALSSFDCQSIFLKGINSFQDLGHIFFTSSIDPLTFYQDQNSKAPQGPSLLILSSAPFLP